MRRLVSLALLSAAGLAHAQPQGRLLVLNKADDTAQFIAQPGGESVTLPTGRGPHEAAVSPDGRLAVAANYENPAAPTLTVYNADASEVVRTIDLGESKAPHGLAFVPGDGPDAGLLAITCEGSKHLVLINIESGEVAARIGTGANGSHMVAITPDGARAFVANIPDGTVSAIDLAARTLLKVVPTGPGAEGIDVTPDGREVWVANRSHSVSVIDAASLDVLETIECPGFPIRCKVTPDGARVLVSCAQAGELAVFDRKARDETARVRILQGDSSELGPIGILITPGGGHAFVANSGHDEVVLVDLAALTVVRRIETGDTPDGLAWIPGSEREPRPEPANGAKAAQNDAAS
ncbi:MAG TPA: YncE family protein [Phycisphaerales bacterium]|nr:YncE family protein [Phycisphaerales bacterium]